VEAVSVGKITDIQSNALEQCSEKNEQSLIIQGTSNALEQCSNGDCEHCKQAFKKRTTWQRFCSSLCREQSYFKKTGIKTGSLLKD
jgi:Zn finger protein HypA/HybF involved in hydrogenase expression